jgi:hypothetical protein
MKWALAVVLLLISFTSVALADGSDIPPVKSSTSPRVNLVLSADGSDIPPIVKTAMAMDIAA